MNNGFLDLGAAVALQEDVDNVVNQPEARDVGGINRNVKKNTEIYKVVGLEPPPDPEDLAKQAEAKKVEEEKERDRTLLADVDARIKRLQGGDFVNSRYVYNEEKRSVQDSFNPEFDESELYPLAPEELVVQEPEESFERVHSQVERPKLARRASKPLRLRHSDTEASIMDELGVPEMGSTHKKNNNSMKKKSILEAAVDGETSQMDALNAAEKARLAQFDKVVGNLSYANVKPEEDDPRCGMKIYLRVRSYEMSSSHAQKKPQQKETDPEEEAPPDDDSDKEEVNVMDEEIEGALVLIENPEFLPCFSPYVTFTLRVIRRGMSFKVRIIESCKVKIPTRAMIRDDMKKYWKMKAEEVTFPGEKRVGELNATPADDSCVNKLEGTPKGVRIVRNILIDGLFFTMPALVIMKCVEMVAKEKNVDMREEELRTALNKYGDVLVKYPCMMFSPRTGKELGFDMITSLVKPLDSKSEQSKEAIKSMLRVILLFHEMPRFSLEKVTHASLVLLTLEEILAEDGSASLPATEIRAIGYSSGLSYLTQAKDIIFQHGPHCNGFFSVASAEVEIMASVLSNVGKVQFALAEIFTWSYMNGFLTDTLDYVGKHNATFFVVPQEYGDKKHPFFSEVLDKQQWRRSWCPIELLRTKLRNLADTFRVCTTIVFLFCDDVAPKIMADALDIILTSGGHFPQLSKVYLSGRRLCASYNCKGKWFSELIALNNLPNMIERTKVPGRTNNPGTMNMRADLNSENTENYTTMHFVERLLGMSSMSEAMENNIVFPWSPSTRKKLCYYKDFKIVFDNYAQSGDKAAIINPGKVAVMVPDKSRTYTDYKKNMKTTLMRRTFIQMGRLCWWKAIKKQGDLLAEVIALYEPLDDGQDPDQVNFSHRHPIMQWVEGCIVAINIGNGKGKPTHFVHEEEVRPLLYIPFSIAHHHINPKSPFFKKIEKGVIHFGEGDKGSLQDIARLCAAMFTVHSNIQIIFTGDMGTLNNNVGYLKPLREYMVYTKQIVSWFDKSSAVVVKSRDDRLSQLREVAQADIRGRTIDVGTISMAAVMASQKMKKIHNKHNEANAANSANEGKEVTKMSSSFPDENPRRKAGRLGSKLRARASLPSLLAAVRDSDKPITSFDQVVTRVVRHAPRRDLDSGPASSQGDTTVTLVPEQLRTDLDVDDTKAVEKARKAIAKIIRPTAVTP